MLDKLPLGSEQMICHVSDSNVFRLGIEILAEAQIFDSKVLYFSPGNYTTCLEQSMNVSLTAHISPPVQVPVGVLENENERGMNEQTAPSAGRKTLDTKRSSFSNSWCTFIGSEMQNVWQIWRAFDPPRTSAIDWLHWKPVQFLNFKSWGHN